MKKNIAIVAVLLLQINFVYAHVGNLNTTLEGMAGPYHVLINIKVPDVIPGTATLTVFTSNQPGVKIYARPIYFSSGEDGAPSPDLLTSASNQPGRFEGSMWLMNNGSASIELSISGPLGKGKMLVPVVAVSVTTKKLPSSTANMLIGLGIFLFILMITIVGASVSDGIAKSGEAVPAGTMRSKRIGFVIATILCSVLVYGGNKWWTSVANKTNNFVFKPMHAEYNVEQVNGENRLSLTIDTANSQRSAWLPYIIPDHGKIMHLFIVSLPGMNVFAHVHPERTGLLNFAVDLPSLPQGKYLAYADIVYNSGFTETLKDTISITNLPAGPKTDSLLDPDDALDFSKPLKTGNGSLDPVKNVIIGNHTGEVAQMSDGTMIMMEAPQKEKTYFNSQVYTLNFSVWDKNKQPVKPDLYMGMQGHAIIVRDDGMVFSHIHPVGTYSMAAQTSLLDRISQPESVYKNPDNNAFRDSVDHVLKLLQEMPEQEREDYLMKEMKMPESGSMSSIPGMNGSGHGHMNMQMDAGNTVGFPYSFPSPGRYRIWVEVKKKGHIYTAVFDRDVK